MSAPRVCLRDPSIVQAFNLFADYIDQIQGGSSGSITTTNVVRVDKGGNDLTGQRNNFALPFQTIQAAVNAAVIGDVVLVGPGLFNEQVIVPPTKGLSIIGSGYTETFLNFPGQALIWNPSADANFVVSDIGLVTGGISVTPTVNNVGAASIIGFNRLQFPPAPASGITLNQINVAVISGCIGNTSGPSMVSLGNCGIVSINDGLVFSVTSTYDASLAMPLAPSDIEIISSKLISVVNTLQSRMSVQNSSIRNTTLVSVNDDALTRSYGTFTANDSDLGNVAVAVAYSAVAVSDAVFDVKRCGVRDLVTNAALTATGRIKANAKECTIDATGQILAGDNVDLDIRGSQYEPSKLTIGGGTGRVDRSMDVIANTPIFVSPGGPITIPIPYIQATYMVMFEFVTANASAYVGAKANNQFAAGTIYVGGTNANIVLLQQ